MSSFAQYRPKTQAQSDAGFTLVEVLAALAVFSIAALGILNVSSENITAAQRVDTKAFARIVAENRLFETLSHSRSHQIGIQTGIEEMGRRKWRWTQIIAETPNPLLLEVRVSVSELSEDVQYSGGELSLDSEVWAYETK